MRVLVTGHNGYFGSVLVPVLLAAGHDVVGLDSFLFERWRFGRGVPAAARSVRKDIRDVLAVDLRGFDAAVHLAAVVHLAVREGDPLALLNLRGSDQVNYLAAVQVARLVRDAGARRFLFASSCAVYGNAPEGTMAAEDTPVRLPATPYVDSKARAEEDILALAGGGFCPVVLRNTSLYGVSPCMRTDIVLNSMVAWALTAGRIRVTSDPATWRPVAHIGDAARVFLAMLDAPEHTVCGQIFNVGEDAGNLRLGELAEVAQGAVPGAEIVCEASAARSDWSCQVDFGKLARTLPGLRFQWDAKAGAAEVRNALVRERLTREDVEGGRFARLPQIRWLVEAGMVDINLRRTRQEANCEHP